MLCRDGKSSCNREKGEYTKRRLWEVYLLESERIYVGNLEFLLNSFFKPLVQITRYNTVGSKSAVLKAAEKTKVYALQQLISQLVALNKSFLLDIEKSFNSSYSKGKKEVLISLKGADTFVDVLSRYIPIFRQYLAYFSLKTFAESLINKYSSEPQFVVLLKQRKTNKNKLLQLLEKPLEQLKSYENILKKLLDETDDIKERQKLHNTITYHEETKQKLYEEMKKQKNISRLKSIANEWNNGATELIIPGREVIKEGTLYISGVQHQFVLFNDVLIYGISSFASSRFSHKYKHVGTVPVNSITLNLLELRHLEIRTPFVSVWVTSAEDVISGWYKDISQAVSCFDSANMKKADEVEQSLSNLCCCCRLTFASASRLCGYCELAVCNKCSESRLMYKANNIAGFSESQGTEVPVCNGCYMKHMMNNSESNCAKQPWLKPLKIKDNIDFRKAECTLQETIFIEIIETEKSYLENLKILDVVYVKPLIEDYKSGSFSLGSKLFNTFNEREPRSVWGFMNSVGHIAAISKQFLDDLLKVWQNWTDDNIAVVNVFEKYARLFHVYEEYAGSIAFVTKVLMTAEASDVLFVEFLGTQKRIHHSKLQCANDPNIHSLFILPIQRIPRYILLLKRLCEAITHPYIDGKLNDTIEVFKKIADCANYKLKEQEEEKIIYDLFREWGLSVLVSCDDNPYAKYNYSRKLIHAGKLVKVSRKTNIPYEFLLFNDVLMYGKRETTKRVKHHRSIPIHNITCSPDQDNDALFIKSREKSFKVFAQSSQDKDVWMQKLQSLTFQNNVKTEDLAPLWVTDKDVSVCQVCETSFSTFLRRHHCRKCGRCICANCSTQRCMLPHIHKAKPQRVCDICISSIVPKNAVVEQRINQNCPKHSSPPPLPPRPESESKLSAQPSGSCKQTMLSSREKSIAPPLPARPSNKTEILTQPTGPFKQTILSPREKSIAPPLPARPSNETEIPTLRRPPKLPERRSSMPLKKQCSFGAKKRAPKLPERRKSTPFLFKSENVASFQKLPIQKICISGNERQKSNSPV